MPMNQKDHECYNALANVHYPRHNFCPTPSGGPHICIHCGLLEGKDEEPALIQSMHKSTPRRYPQRGEMPAD